MESITSKITEASNNAAKTFSNVVGDSSATVADSASNATSSFVDSASAVANSASAPAATGFLDSTPSTSGSPFWWLKYVAIIIVLAFVGINVFKLMGDATDTTAGILAPILGFFGRTSGALIKQTSNVAARGTTGAITAANTGVNSAVNALEGDVDRKQGAPPPPPKPDKRKHRGGFCYIGEEDGFRSCVEVNKADQCMSGEIFPTREICVNPQLRM